MFGIFRALDRVVIRPAAMGYKHVVPKLVRRGIRHFFSNLGEPIVFVNDVLQLRPKRAVRTFGRFAINTTLGVGGLLDVAKHEGIPHRPNGFGDTLGYYGVKPGPYLFIPVLGPSDLRDVLGGSADGLVLPTVVGHPFDQWRYKVVKAVLTGLDDRAEHDAELKALFSSALDPYATLRSVYVQSRAAEIRDLKAKDGAAATDLPELDDPLADPATGSAAAGDASEFADPLIEPAATAAAVPHIDAPAMMPEAALAIGAPDVD